MKPTKRPDPKRRKQVRKELSLHIRVTEAQKAELSAAAERAGIGLSSWMLAVALRAARKADGGDGL
jgi:uncharacterized protein (DUF1778 family)